MIIISFAMAAHFKKKVTLRQVHFYTCSSIVSRAWGPPQLLPTCQSTDRESIGRLDRYPGWWIKKQMTLELIHQNHMVYSKDWVGAKDSPSGVNWAFRGCTISATVTLLPGLGHVWGGQGRFPTRKPSLLQLRSSVRSVSSSCTARTPPA